MKTFKPIIILTASLLSASSCAQSRLHPEKKVDINVVVTDLEGKPIPMALVLNGKEGYAPIHKFTGADGIARFERVGQVEFNPVILKNGFYAHMGSFLGDVRLPGVEREYRVVLKPVLDPVPMERTEMRRRFFPLVGNESLAFDLEKMDFVAPHGQGTVTDLVFRCSWSIERNAEGQESPRVVSRTIVSVAGEHDGLLPFEAVQAHSISSPASVLMPPNRVPTSGLLPAIEFATLLSPFYTPPHNRESQNIAFRVRTKMGESGAVEHCHVGWLEAPVVVELSRFVGPQQIKYEGDWIDFKPEWGVIGFTRHWNPNPKSMSLEPNSTAKRWENALPHYITTYQLQNLLGIETLHRLPRNHPQYLPTQEEENERIRQEHAERKKEWERKRAETQKAAPAP